MHHLAGMLVVLGIAAALVTLLASLAAWWGDAARRTRRGLTQLLGAPPDVVLLAPLRSQGAGLWLDGGKLALVRGAKDPGLVFELYELIGAELIFDGQVAARMFRGEGRKALDQLSPGATRITLRMVFDDVRDPDFEIELLSPEDEGLRGALEPHRAVREARAWFTRLEAVLRQTDDGASRFAPR